MIGRFVGSAEKLNFSYDNMLESDRQELFTKLIGYDAQNAWLVGDRALIYRMGSKIRRMEAYLGAMSQDFVNNFMSEFGDNWIWSGIGFSIISKNAIASETYSLGG